YFSLAGRQSIRDDEKWNTALAFTSAVGTTGLRGRCPFIGFLECGTSINLSQPDTIAGSRLTSCRIVVGVLVLFLDVFLILVYFSAVFCILCFVCVLLFYC